jgi:hypothetical protein
MSSLGDAPQGYRQKARGQEGDSRKQREEEQKQKQQEYFVVRGSF